MKSPVILLVLTLLACGAAAVASGATATPSSQTINVAAEDFKRTAQIKSWNVSPDAPSKVGTYERGFFCNGSGDIIYTKSLHQYLTARMTKVFKERTAELGYPKYQSSDSAFADSAAAAADFRVGFTVVDMNYKICARAHEVSGTASIKLKAELFSNKLQKVLYSRTIDGNYASAESVKMDIFFDGLLGNALDQMLGDQKYVAAYRDDALLASETPADLIAVRNGAKPKDSVKKDSKGILSAVVTIETGTSSGSGFYIGRDGYIITNEHVVGAAKYVKVRLPGGYAVSGEVVRREPARDVALIKTNIEPPTAMFVRVSAVSVGEEVFAIGSPFGEQLSSTVTRGILSGERTLNEQKFIQSDVAVNPGNSGGPLVDADGALIAIADVKIRNAEGIALFIPIAEVLAQLGLNLQ